MIYFFLIIYKYIFFFLGGGEGHLKNFGIQGGPPISDEEAGGASYSTEGESTGYQMLPSTASQNQHPLLKESDFDN